MSPSIIECIEIALVSAASEPNQTKNDQLINRMKRDLGMVVCGGFNNPNPNEGFSAAMIGLTYAFAIALIGIPPDRRQDVGESITEEAIKTSNIIENILKGHGR